MNTWLNGKRHAISQSEHEAWNRQICVECEEPTGNCEEDDIYTAAGYGPLCIKCAQLYADEIED